MNDSPATAFAEPLELLHRVNELCNRFESEWRGGQQPRIEAYLAEVDTDDRPMLLRQLLPLDADYRRCRGEAPAADDYLARFPELNRSWLAAVLATTCDPEAGPRTSPDDGASGRDSSHPPVLGDYVLLDRIGAGGMGRVYRARHRRMNRTVALKVLPASAAGNPDRVRRFRREMEAAAKLAHPNLVTAYDAGEDQGVHYLVTESIDGLDLARLVQRDGPPPVATAVDYVLQAARGLAHAHAAGVIHRDVKPANLMLDGRGVVRVLDVGLARILSSAGQLGSGAEAGGTTAPGVLLGTVDYMAPEQASDPARADERADVYGLGATLHYLLTGRPVFDGADVWERLYAHRERPVPSLRQARGDVSEALDRVFRKMLAKDPARRHRSMADVIHDLESCRDGAQPARGSRVWSIRAALCAAAGLVALLAAERVWPRGETSAEEAGAGAVALADVPFAAPQDYQRRWAAWLGRPIELTNDLGMRMALIPPGRFQMGSDDAEIEALAAGETFPGRRAKLRSEAHREVTLEHPFYLGATEVTVGQFRVFVNETGHRTHAERHGNGYGVAGGAWVIGPDYRWDAAGDQPVTAEHPVFNVSWDDAVAFCVWLTERSPAGPVYRLPTEAEWEYACRAGRLARWCYGDNPSELGRYAWYEGNARGFVRRVGRKLPNAFGLYDLHGNRAEWCGDTTPDPRAPAEERRPLRGGRFSGSPSNLRCAARDWEHRTAPVGGIRVLAELPAPGR